MNTPDLTETLDKPVNFLSDETDTTTLASGKVTLPTTVQTYATV